MKLQTVVHRCVLLGCDIPSEPTCGNIVGALLMLSQTTMDGKAAHSVILDFKRALKTAFKGQSGDVSITEFPPEPSMLPQQRLEFAYKDGLPAKLHTITSTPTIPLRRSATSIRSSSSSGQQASTGQLDASMVLQMITNLAGAQMGRNVWPNAGINLQMLNNHKRPALALANSPQESQSPNEGSPLAIADGRVTMPIASHSEATPIADKDAVAVQSHASKPDQTPQQLFQFPSMSPEQHINTVTAALDARTNARLDADDSESNKGCMKRPSANKTKPPKKVSLKHDGTQPKAAAKAAGSKKSVSTSSSSLRNRPCVPKSGAGTQWYRGGKIHESTRMEAWRVFVNKSDRCDKAHFNFIDLFFLCSGIFP